MLENRLAGNRPCPVLHEIVLADPLKYLRVVTGSFAEVRFHYIKVFLVLFAKRAEHKVCMQELQRSKMSPSDTVKCFCLPASQ